MIDLIDYIERCSSRKSTYRLADFFNRWWDEYAQHPAEYITPEQYKAVNAIRVCRTAALGIDTYACPECGEIREISHSCKNRFCPSCGWRDTLKWAARMKEKMLRVPHRHVVMTLPHILLDVVKRNKKELLNILMRTSADTLKDWMMHKFGLKIGVIAVLHTYGDTTASIPTKATCRKNTSDGMKARLRKPGCNRKKADMKTHISASIADG